MNEESTKTPDLDDLSELARIVLIFLHNRGREGRATRDELWDVAAWYFNARDGKIEHGPAQIELVLGSYVTLHVEDDRVILRITEKGRAAVADETEGHHEG